MSIKQKTLQKYEQLCIDKNYTFINAFKRVNNFITMKCNICGYECERQATNFMRQQSKCQQCRINEYTRSAQLKGFEYQSHRHHTITYVTIKCQSCSSTQEICSSTLNNLTFKCSKCQRKKFVRGFIYKLKIKDIHNRFFYIGLTENTLKARYTAHSKSCFNTRKKEYHSKKYVMIRKELKRMLKRRITRKDFLEYVIMSKVAVVNTTRQELKELESELINLNNPDSLNSIN